MNITITSITVTAGSKKNKGRVCVFADIRVDILLKLGKVYLDQNGVTYGCTEVYNVNKPYSTLKNTFIFFTEFRNPATLLELDGSAPGQQAA